MPRNVTVTFSDGTKHVYQNAPDNVTPEQITARASKDFGKDVAALDGGRSAPRTNGGTINTGPLGNPASPSDALAARANTQPRQPAPRKTGNVMTNVLGGLAEGVAGLPDLAVSGYNSLMRQANPHHARKAEVPLAQAGIDRYLPAREGGDGARLGGQVLGGFAVPVKGKSPRPGYTAPVAVQRAAVAARQAPKAAPSVNSLASAAMGHALDVVKAGKEFKVPVYRSDIKPPKTAIGKFARKTGEIIPVFGTGGMRAEQQAARTEAVSSFVKEFGEGHSDDVVAEVAKDFEATRGKAIAGFTKQKNSVIEGIEGAVPTPKAVAAIDEQITRLAGINADEYAPVIAKLESFKNQLASGKNLSQIEGNRKLLGDLFADPSLAAIKGDGQKALNAIYGPLRDDMGAFIQAKGGKDAFNRWGNANKQLAALAGELDAAAFKSTLNKIDSTPEAVAKLIFNKSPSEIKRLYGNLSAIGRNKAQSAIVLKVAEGATESGVINPQKFATAMEKMDKATGVFFAGPDKARLEGLTRLIKATQHASEAAAAPLTGVQNLPAVVSVGLTQIFGLTGGLGLGAGAGLLARAYEKAPVRDALLRLGRAPAGSKMEAVEMNRAITAITAAAAANKEKIGEVANDVAAKSPGRAAAQDEEN